MTQRTNETQRVDSLQIKQDLEFERREWRTERALWIAMATVVLAAVLGVTGPGLVSHTEVRGPGLAAEYDRMLRIHLATDVRIEARARAGDALRLALSREYLEGFRVLAITPEPERQDPLSRPGRPRVPARAPRRDDLDHLPTRARGGRGVAGSRSRPVRAPDRPLRLPLAWTIHEPAAANAI